ncbi:MAG TPA: DUF445 family protein [Chitinophagales bacterium]|nr:DUF445 family protein [Chitinophagales bacterium]
MNSTIYTLPVIAALIGWFTNYIAIKMLFWPRNKIQLGPLALQGVFPKRQKAVAEKIGRLVSDELLSVHDIKERINQPETLDMINRKVEAKIEEYLAITFPSNYPLMSIFLSRKIKSKLKHDFLQEVDDLAPQIVEQYIATMEGHLNIEKIIKERISLLSPARLEDLIMQILQKEFRFIELVGAVLGFFIGIVQLSLVLI